MGTRQHYVPQFLLRGFVDPATARLHVFDKQTENSFTKSPKRIGADHGFYDHTDSEGEPASIDPMLTQLEDASAPIVQRLREAETASVLTASDRDLLALFCTAQMTRVPAKFAMQHDMMQLLREELMRRGQARIGQPDPEQTRLAALQLITQARTFVPSLLAKLWVVGKAPPDDSLYLSDNPISRYNSIQVPGRGNLGLNCRGIELHLPISSGLDLWMLCPSLWAGYAPQDDAAIRRGGPLPLNAGNVEHLNALQVGGAERYLFSCNNDFTLVREMLRDHPELKSGPRFTVG